MKREEILSEMKAALARYRTIKDEEFNFSMFVFVLDDTNNCGSICCLWGWEPKFGILPVEWIGYNLNINKKPQQVLKWGAILYYLYYPTDYFSDHRNINQIIGYTLKSDSSLNRVLKAWERVIELIETTDKLDEFLNLD